MALDSNDPDILQTQVRYICINLKQREKMIARLKGYQLCLPRGSSFCRRGEKISFRSFTFKRDTKCAHSKSIETILSEPRKNQ